MKPGRCEIEVRAFVESYQPEGEILATARVRATEMGITPVAPSCGAVLRTLAAAANAKAIVEIGTGTGVSGTWLLRGARPDAILTTIDIEPEIQRQARKTFAEAGADRGRTRIIAGRALDVLPRLADGAYDLVFVDAEPAEYAEYVEAAMRLLRSGGLLVVHDALAAGRVPDPAARDARTVAVREVVKGIRAAEEWVPALLPAGAGLLLAAKR